MHQALVRMAYNNLSYQTCCHILALTAHRWPHFAGAALHQNVQSSLRAVNLWQNGVCDKQVWQYSGGMKRRLSVAISFMGNPIAVYLDEPSTVSLRM